MMYFNIILNNNIIVLDCVRVFHCLSIFMLTI